MSFSGQATWCFLRTGEVRRTAVGFQANPGTLVSHMQSGRYWISLAFLSSAWLTSCLISPKDYPLGLDSQPNGASGGEENDGASGGTSPKGDAPNQGGASSRAGNGSGAGSSSDGGADGSGGIVDVGGTSAGGKGGTPSAGNGGSSGSAGSGGSGGSSGSGGSGGSDGSPGCPTGLSVTYKADTTTASTTFLGGELQIDNQGDAIVDVSDLRLRYYFTNEVTASVSNTVNWALMGPSNNRSADVTVQLDLVPLAVPKPKADSYLEFKFQSDKALSGGYIIIFSWKSGAQGSGQNFTQTNDYSFSPSDPTDYSKLVLFDGDCVVYGTPP